MQRGFKTAVNRHHLAGRLHLRGYVAVSVGKLVERPAGNLYNAIVQRRFERGAGRPGNFVWNLVKAFPHGDFSRYPRDGVPGGFAGQRRRAAHPRVDLDNVILGIGIPIAGAVPHGVRMGSRRQLNVAPTFDTQTPDDFEAGSAQHLVLFVGKRLAGRYDNAVTGMGAHRIEVFHVANGDAIIRAVADNLVFDLFPPNQ